MSVGILKNTSSVEHFPKHPFIAHCRSLSLKGPWLLVSLFIDLDFLDLLRSNFTVQVFSAPWCSESPSVVEHGTSEHPFTLVAVGVFLGRKPRRPYILIVQKCVCIWSLPSLGNVTLRTRQSRLNFPPPWARLETPTSDHVRTRGLAESAYLRTKLNKSLANDEQLKKLLPWLKIYWPMNIEEKAGVFRLSATK